MKKSLFAVAAAGAFAGVAGTAAAQSSVTVYGLLDAGYIGSAYKGTAVTAGTAGTGSTGTLYQKSNTSQFGQSAESTSRLGLRGTEDIGGGLSSFFTAEWSMNPNSANGLATTNRQTFVGLKKNGIGAASFGTQYTPIHNLAAITDAAELNNLVGNAVYATSVQSGTGGANYGVAPYAGATASQSLNGANGAYTTRVSNALVFKSDRVGGVAVSLMYALMSQDQTVSGTAFNANAGGNSNQTVFGASADYTWQKLQVGAAYQVLKGYNPSQGSATSATATAGTSTIAGGSAGSFGFNMQDTQFYGAATYDFGILKGYLQYVNRKVTSQVDASFQSTRSGEQVGVRSWITPTVSGFATYGLGKSAYYGQSIASSPFRTFQIGADYWLSKRTNLYALYGQVQQSSNGNATAGTAGNIAAGGSSVSASNYALGVRHTF